MVTNDEELSSHELVTTYRKLKRIEQSFHSLKSLQEVDFTVPQAIRELGRMKAVEIEVEGKPYLFRTEASKEAKQVFKALHMRPPTRVRELEE